MPSNDPSATHKAASNPSGGAPLVFSRNAATSDAVTAKEPAHNSPQNNLGALLRDARNSKGLSPGDLAQSLNLDLRIVELIEANRLDEAPEPIYVRAYLKHWAGLLDTDAAQLLAAFEAQRTINPRTESLNTHARAPLDVMSSRKATHTPHHNPQARGGRVWGWLATVLIIAGVITVAVFALPSAWQQRIASLIGLPQSQNTRLIAPQSSAEPAPIAIDIPMNGAVSTPNASAPAAGSSPSALPAAAPTEAIPATNRSTESSQTALSGGLPPPPPFGAQESPGLNPTTQAQANPPAANAADSAPNLPAPAPATAADNNLVIKANSADCWVEVQDAKGKRLIYDVLKKGSERSLPGAGPFSVILGNPAAVTVLWKGEPVKLGAPNTTTGVVRTKVGGP